MSKITFLFLVASTCIVMLSGCGPSATPPPTEIVVQPTYTPVPTATPYPTYTLYPTYTPEPTDTPLPTDTPVPPTPTPLPPTNTPTPVTPTRTPLPPTYTPTPVPPTDTPTPMPTPHLTGKIAYVMKDGIYMMGADGNNKRRVYEGDLGGSTARCSDWGPMGRAVLSPDGNKITFMRKDGPWVMDANGSGLQQIAIGECTFHITWAPDSKQIFYKAGVGGAYIVKIPGGIPEYIGGGLNEVDWSPDGGWLAYPSDQGLVKRPVPGGSEFVLDPSVGRGVGPAWSPDGTRVAYAKNGDIFVINADGSGQTRLTDHPAGDWEPRWSPDGSKIVFTSERDGNREIYVMNADGSNPMNLTNSAENEEHPSWSP